MASLLPQQATPGPWALPGLSGTIYGAALNLRSDLELMSERFAAPPHGTPPKAPVLYLKTANTLAMDGAAIECPANTPALWASVHPALVIDRRATGLTPANALAHVRGVGLALDLRAPHESLHRPAIREQCQDGSLPLSSELTALSDLGDLAALTAWVEVDGVRGAEFSTANYARSIVRLLCDVTAFMTLAPGDILLTGTPHRGADAKPGARLRAHLSGFAPLDVCISPSKASA